MGDVAMCVPVIRLLLQQHENIEISFVSDKKLAPLFANISRCHFIGADLKGENKGLIGLFRLFKSISSKKKVDAIADLHGVIRSVVLKSYFLFSGKPISTIDKGRSEKRKLTAKQNKSFHQLTSGFERYADVFKQMGYLVNLQSSQLTNVVLPLPVSAEQYFKNKTVIGIAPFAKHAEKMYPLDKMKTVVEELSKSDVTILLFGGGKIEKSILDNWAGDSQKNIINITGKYSLEEELAIISNLKLMCSMDSANMHLASLFGVPVVSIWGATHPYAGFLGWGQSETDAIGLSLACRPCSVYGNKKCHRGDHACMNMISTDRIISRIEYNLSKHSS